MGHGNLGPHLAMERSDLPRALHIVCTDEEGKEQIYDVQLALPGESQVTRIQKLLFLVFLTAKLPVAVDVFFLIQILVVVDHFG